MPIELQIIRAAEFVRLDAKQHLDFDASQLVLQSLAEACQKRGIDCALLDLRTVPVPDRPQFTIRELTLLAGTFHAAGFSRRQRLAILYRLDVHGGIKIFADVSRQRGLQVQAFAEFEGAMNWLSETRRRGGREFALPIPITRRRRGKPLPVSFAPIDAVTHAPRPVRSATPKHR